MPVDFPSPLSSQVPELIWTWPSLLKVDCIMALSVPATSTTNVPWLSNRPLESDPMVLLDCA